MGNGRRITSGSVMSVAFRARPDGFGAGANDAMMLNGAFETETPVQRSLMSLKIAKDATSFQQPAREVR
jgi:hypothetical protein